MERTHQQPSKLFTGKDFEQELRDRLACIEEKLDAALDCRQAALRSSGSLCSSPVLDGGLPCWPRAPAPPTPHAHASPRTPGALRCTPLAQGHGNNVLWITPPLSPAPRTNRPKVVEEAPWCRGKLQDRAGQFGEQVESETLRDAAVGDRHGRPVTPTAWGDDHGMNAATHPYECNAAGPLREVVDSSASKEMSDLAKSERRSKLSFALPKDKSFKRYVVLADRGGFSQTAASVKAMLDDPEAQWGWNIVHCTAFSLVTSFVIMFNAVFIGWQTSMMLQSRIDNAEFPEQLAMAGEVCFTTFFVGEILLRMAVERLLFLIGPEWKWNLFDFVLVAMSLVDLLLVNDGKSTSKFTLGRLLRLARFFRLARLTRVIRNFGSLRVMLFAILDSMGTLFWCFIIIVLIQYLFAVLFMTAVADYFEENSSTADPTHLDELREYYGSFGKSMVILFMVISGGLDWRDVAMPLEVISPVYLPIFIFYMFFMQFGVLNVVVGTFVATLTDIANKDKESMVKFELEAWKNYTDGIRSFFLAADTDKSGTLSWEELSRHLQDRKVKAYFQAMDLDISQAHVLFELLDANGNNSISLDEFCQGCIRLKGSAKSVDLNMLLMKNRRLCDQVQEYAASSESRFKRLEEELGVETTKEVLA